MGRAVQMYVYTLERQASLTKFMGAAIIIALIGWLMIALARYTASEGLIVLGKVLFVIAGLVVFAAFIVTQTWH